MLINDSALYISTKRFVNYDGRIIRGYMGFYADGRAIIDDTDEKEMDQLTRRHNSYTTAAAIGYYTTDGNKITAEFFVSGDGGQYTTRQGIIKQDTIVIIDKVRDLIKRITRYDTLVKSPYPLRPR